ncbi:MAG: hypothetical protein ACM3S2_02105 [Ignavibacteriales bacterium]
MKTKSYFCHGFLFIFALIILSGCSGKKSGPVSNDPVDNPSTVDVFWKALSVPSGVACATADVNGNIWAGTSVGIYKSPDGGTTWNKVTTAGFTVTSGTSLIRSDLSGKIYALVGSDIFAFNSSSSSWRNISQNVNSSTVSYSLTHTFNLDKSGNIYAGMYISEKPDPQTIGIDKNVLYKSADGGQTWTEIKITQFQGQIRDIAFDSNGAILIIMDASVYRSLDGGKTWNKAISGINSANPLLLRVNSKNIIYAGTGNGLMRSSDTGITWDPANYSTYCMSLNINPKDIIFAGAINSCFFTQDNAATWIEVSSGLKHSIDGFSDCIVQTFDKDGYVYSILEGVLYKSTISTTR